MHQRNAVPVSLLASAGVQNLDSSLEEVLVKRSRSLRSEVEKRWTEVPPSTPGWLAVEPMQKALGHIAEKLLRDGQVTVAQARATISVLPGFLLTRKKKDRGEQFLRLLQEMGILAIGRFGVRFTHRCLLHLFMGQRLLEHPNLLAKFWLEPNTSVDEASSERARAALACLGLAEDDGLDELFERIFSHNIHLPAWFLYYNPAGHRRLGEGYARSLLGVAGWELSTRDLEGIGRSIQSLGNTGLQVCRRVIERHTATLPALDVAIGCLEQQGELQDVELLAALRRDPRLGWYEVDEMKKLQADLEAMTVDDYTLSSDVRTDLVVRAAKIGLVIGQLVLLGGAEPFRDSHEARETSDAFGEVNAPLVEGALAANTALAGKLAVRKQLDALPAEIEARSRQISRHQRHTRSRAQRAIRRIRKRHGQGGLLSFFS